MIHVNIITAYSPYGLARGAEAFINNRHLTREQIISMSMATNSGAKNNFSSSDSHEVMIVWEDNK